MTESPARTPPTPSTPPTPPTPPQAPQAPSTSRTALPPVFARLAGANLAAQSAEQVSLAAVPMVAALALSAGPGQIGLLATAQTLPFLLLSMPIGLLADRLSKRWVMCVGEALRAGAFFGLLVAGVTGQLSIPLMAGLGFLGATGTVAFSVAAPALVPSLVPREAMAAANARLELARSAAFTAGPALAGALVAWAGATPAFVVAAVLSVAALLLLLQLPQTQAAGAGAGASAGAGATAPVQRHPLLELQEGAAMVWQHRLLRPILLTSVFWNVAWFVLQAAYVPYAVQQLGLGAKAVGLTLSAYGAGMVTGALAARWVMSRTSFGHAVVLGPLMSVLAAATMAASVMVPPAVGAVLAGASFFLFGAGPIIWTISSTTLRQAVTPGAMLGRVTAIFLTLNMGARPVGAAIGAWVGAWHGASACLLLALLGFVLQALLIATSVVRSLHKLPQPEQLPPSQLQKELRG